MVTISDKAAKELREQLLHKWLETGIGFRMLVNAGEPGEATFSIKLDRQDQRDKVIDLGGVKVFLDPSSAARIRDYQLDYQDGPDSGFFLKTYKEAKIG